MKPPTRPTLPPLPSQAPNRIVQFGKIVSAKGHRAVLYGTGGIGKTTLACLAPGPIAFVDADESLGILKTRLEEMEIEMPTPVEVSSWKGLRESLQSGGWDKIKTIVIDTMTKAEEWCVEHTVKTVKHEKGHYVKSVEDYGFGKGFQFIFDTFLPLLADLDTHIRAGRNVIMIAHECTSHVPNPKGEDWLRYEPRLQNPTSGKASIRLRLKEWADHVLFLGYDVNVDKEGKAEGSGTRTLYTSELPFCMAKSRTTSEQFDIEPGVSPWEGIIK